MIDFDDRQLARLAADGDAEAFGEMYRRHRDRVFNFAYRMIGVRAIAEEITHEAFVVLIEHPERYSPERGSLLTFLCAVARHHVMHYLRRGGREVDAPDDTGAFVADGGDDDPLGALLDDELAVFVERAISELPPPLREAIVLREMQELSYEEIAVVTGADVNLVKVRLHRARKRLKERLAPYMMRDGSESHELC